jgi:nucleoside-triphosphatase THEP1
MAPFKQHENILLITGAVQSGKTTFLEEIAQDLDQKGAHLAGFLSKGSFDGDRRVSFMLTDLREGRCVQLAHREPREGWFRFRSFYFNPGAFLEGERWILDGLSPGASTLMLDEVGPLELDNRGWYKLLEVLANEYTRPQVWVVRKDSVEDVCRKWHIPSHRVFERGVADKNELVQMILKYG